MSSQMTILQTQIGNMDDVSADAVATQISLLQTQIQTAYELTSRIHSLSLAQYLPTS
jgi:flagellar hook-associated protein 3 FlgL